MQTPRGRCLCGKVRYAFDPAGVSDQTHCHCESCRRATSSAMTSYFTVRNSAWRWTAEIPAAHVSSPGVTRWFCGTCGTPMAYGNAARPDETDIHAVTLDDPTEFAPTAHAFWSEKLPWIALKDGLPRHSGDTGTAPIAKGKGRS